MTELLLTPFIKDRNTVLLQDFDFGRYLGFFARWKPALAPPSSEHVAEISFHQARSAVVNLPEEMRRASREWLKAHGCQHWGDEPQ